MMRKATGLRQESKWWNSSKSRESTSTNV